MTPRPVNRNADLQLTAEAGGLSGGCGCAGSGAGGLAVVAGRSGGSAMEVMPRGSGALPPKQAAVQRQA